MIVYFYVYISIEVYGSFLYTHCHVYAQVRTKSIHWKVCNEVYKNVYKPGTPFATGVLSANCTHQVCTSIQSILGVVQFLAHWEHTCVYTCVYSQRMYTLLYTYLYTSDTRYTLALISWAVLYTLVYSIVYLWMNTFLQMWTSTHNVCTKSIHRKVYNRVHKSIQNQVYNLPLCTQWKNVYNKYSWVYSVYYAFSEFFRVHMSIRVVYTSIQKKVHNPKLLWEQNS